MSDRLNDIIMGLFVALLSLTVIYLAKGIYNEIFDNHNYIALDVKQWDCTETKTYYTTIMVGKVPTQMSQTQCINYKRK